MKNKSKKHWIVMLICCLMSSASIGLIINAMGVFYTPVAQSLGVMQGTIAAQGTITLVLGASMSFKIPKLINKYSFKKILIVSALIASVSTALMGLVDNIVVFHLLGAIRGIFSAFFSMVPLTMIINNWFVKKHGLATSLVLGLSGMAGAVFSPIFATLIENYGWQLTYLVKGIILMLLCLPAILYPFSLNPQDNGLLPYGKEEEEMEGDKAAVLGLEFKLTELTFICFLAFSTLIAALTTIAHHLPGFADSIGQSTTTGALLLSASMVGNVLFKVLIGLLSDAFGAIKSCFIMIVINIVGLILLMTAGSTEVLILASFFFGALFSVGSVGAALLTKHFFGLDNFPKCYPFVAFIGGIGAALALAAIGYLYDFTGSYSLSFTVALIFHVIAMILFVFVCLKKSQAD